LRLSYTVDWSKDIAQALKLLSQALQDESRVIGVQLTP